MAKKKHVRVVGLSDRLIVGKIQVDRDGTDLSESDVKKVQEAADAAGVQLSVEDGSTSDDEESAEPSGTATTPQTRRS